MKLFLLFLTFILCFLGLEIYRNTALMDRGYLLQKLEVKKVALIEENGYLQEKLSPYLSLNRLEDYARKELGLVNPEKVRFLKGNFSPPEESSSPPPFIDKLKIKLKSPISKIVGQIRRWFDIFYEKKEQ
ncbi:hypothetical protein IBX65_05825 [Candidatus Aerophobetes bacterium]|nr:hypothetical protein [Candidatus Aerophobetes bacterium]